MLAGVVRRSGRRSRWSLLCRRRSAIRRNPITDNHNLNTSRTSNTGTSRYAIDAPPFGSWTQRRQFSVYDTDPRRPPTKWSLSAGAKVVPTRWRNPPKLVPTNWRTTSVPPPRRRTGRVRAEPKVPTSQHSHPGASEVVAVGQLPGGGGTVADDDHGGALLQCDRLRPGPAGRVGVASSTARTMIGQNAPDAP
jgi:hypothetical protein